MIFCDSVCFDITITGEKSKVEKLVNYLKSGELNDFFEIEDDFFLFDDHYETSKPETEVRVIFSSDEFGIEIGEFDTDEFLEALCKAGKSLHLSGSFYNLDDEELRFISEVGDDYYVNENNVSIFNDELDMQASLEEADEDDDY